MSRPDPSEGTPASPAGRPSGERPAGLRALAQQDRLDVLGAVGGPIGLVESVVPGVVFVVVYALTSELRPSLWASVGLAAAIALVRLVRRESPQQALGGLLGVAVCAFIAQRSGRAEDFYLPGLWINVGYAAAYVVSILARWPLLGVFLGPVIGEGLAWRDDPRRLRAYQQASWIWVLLFLSRLAVQWPLYRAGAVEALGIARVVMGFPLFGLAIGLSWLVLRRVPQAVPGTSDDEPADEGPARS